MNLKAPFVRLNGLSRTMLQKGELERFGLKQGQTITLEIWGTIMLNRLDQIEDTEAL